MFSFQRKLYCSCSLIRNPSEISFPDFNQICSGSGSFATLYQHSKACLSFYHPFYLISGACSSYQPMRLAASQIYFAFTLASQKSFSVALI